MTEHPTDQPEPGSDPLVHPQAGDRRTVDLTRVGPQVYEATNARGGVLRFGSGQNSDFTPVELLLVAIAGCSAVDVELITGKRSEPDSFRVHAQASKVRDGGGNHLADVQVAFDVLFPPGEAGDRAREALPRSIRQSRDRLCTVSRTVALGEPVAYSSTTGPIDPPTPPVPPAPPTR